MIQLRPYQREAIDKTYNYWGNGRSHPIIIAPTAAGKSLILGQMIKEACAYPGTRIYVLSHLKELLEQDAEELLKLDPHADFGFYSAGIGQKNLRRQVTFAGIQSVYQQANNAPPPDIIFVDECHLIPKKATTRYGAFLKDIKKLNPKVKIVGLSATPYRLDSGMLTEGKDAIFDGISYDIPVLDLIEQGYLSPIISKGGIQKIDLSNVHKRGGEYIESELATAASDPDLVKAACAEIVDLGENRKSWIIFASGVDHANMIKHEMDMHEVESEVITGTTSKVDRARLLKDHKSGKLKCLIGIGVLTTGFNSPATDLVALLRATMSTALYVQMVGRGMRIAQGKTDCLLLDYGNNVIEHGPIDKVNPTKGGGGDGDGEAPAKECPDCQAIVFAGCQQCPMCGHAFPPPELNHNSRAFGGAVMSDQVEPEWLDVTDVWYSRHQKKDKPDSVKVAYSCGLTTINEWLCPEHGGYAQQRYVSRRMWLGATADTTNEALDEAEGWNRPSRILVKPKGKYFDIVQFDYTVQIKKEVEHAQTTQEILDEIPF